MTTTNSHIEVIRAQIQTTIRSADTPGEMIAALHAIDGIRDVVARQDRQNDVALAIADFFLEFADGDELSDELGCRDHDAEVFGASGWLNKDGVFAEWSIERPSAENQRLTFNDIRHFDRGLVPLPLAQNLRQVACWHGIQCLAQRSDMDDDVAYAAYRASVSDTEVLDLLREQYSQYFDFTPFDEDIKANLRNLADLSFHELEQRVCF